MISRKGKDDAELLSMISRRSIDSGTIPDRCRTVWIAPVHKAGPRDNPANKRPVCLSPARSLKSWSAKPPTVNTAYKILVGNSEAVSCKRVSLMSGLLNMDRYGTAIPK